MTEHEAQKDATSAGSEQSARSEGATSPAAPSDMAVVRLTRDELQVLFAAVEAARLPRALWKCAASAELKLHAALQEGYR